jgi:natural product precursor
MSTKKFHKKLTLNKKTVSNLDSSEMNKLNGGYLTNVGDTCPITVCEGCITLYATQCPNLCLPNTFEC